MKYLITVLLTLANVASAQYIDGKRCVSLGGSIPDAFTSTGNGRVTFAGPSYEAGWRVRQGHPDTCSTWPGASTVQCFNEPGTIPIVIFAPDKSSEAELDVIGAENKRYLAGFCTEEALQEGYFRYQTGLCLDFLFAVPKGDIGHIVEAKYVCTNDPNFKGDTK